MRGFATIDARPGSNEVAVWITNRTEELRASHVNAVIIDRTNDPNAEGKLYSLTRVTALVLTDGSDPEAVPLDCPPLWLTDFDSLNAETAKRQTEISAAMEAYRVRTKNRSLVEPTLPDVPDRQRFVPSEDTARGRVFAAANYIASAWSAWLLTDEQRRRRTMNPRTSETPWIMPESLNGPTVETFPPDFADRLRVHPLV